MFSISYNTNTKMYYSYKKVNFIIYMEFILYSLDSNQAFEGQLTFEGVLYFHAMNFR